MQASTEVDFLQRKIDDIHAQKEKLTQEYSQLQKMLEASDAELSKVTVVCLHPAICHLL